VKKPLQELEGLEELLQSVEQLDMRHLIRYSGTENKLRVLLEGKDAHVMEQKIDELVRYFKKVLND
jgi:phosphoglucosamine mutase